MVDEKKRLEVLNSLKVLDTEDERRFNEIVYIASVVCDSPVALVSLVDKNRQWFKARFGIEVNETPRSVAFCDHAIRNEGLFEIENATQDARFSENPLVLEHPSIRHYAGVPLEIDGENVGTLCVIDQKVKKLNDLQKEALHKLSSQVVDLLLERRELLGKKREASQYKLLYKALRDLNKLNETSFHSIASMLESYLALGKKYLEMDNAIIGEVKNNEFVVKSVISADEIVKKGQRMPLENTLCFDVVHRREILVWREESIKNPLCLDFFRHFDLQLYLGAPLIINTNVVGTISFSSKNLELTKYNKVQKTLMGVLATSLAKRLDKRFHEKEAARKSKTLNRHRVNNKLLIESSDLGLWKWDVRSGEVRFDKKLSSMLGYKLEEIPPTKNFWASQIHPLDVEKANEVYKKVIFKNQKSFEFLVRLRHRKGHWVTVLTKGKVVEVDSLNQPAFICGTHLNMTNIQKQEQQNNELKEVSQRVQEIAKIGGWKYSIKSGKIILNPQVFRIHGMPVKEDIGPQHALKLYFKPDQEKIKNLVEKAIANKLAFEDVFEFVDQKGRAKTVKIFGEPIFTLEGKVEGVRGYVQDITSFIKKQRQIEELKDRAESANKAKSLFLAKMSHELRTPLNAIIGYSELLLDEESHESTGLKTDIEKIKHSGYHLLNLVNQVLDLSKIENSEIQVHPTKFLVRDLIEEVKVLTNHTVNANKNRLVVDWERKDDLIFADRELLKLILINLISNAGKFTKEGVITVRVLEPDDGRSENWTFEVNDTGIGINPYDKSRIFEAFQQVENSNDRRYDGTGLGLTICKKLAALMRADISLKSEIGKGSSFRLDFKNGPLGTKYLKAS